MPVLPIVPFPTRQKELPVFFRQQCKSPVRIFNVRHYLRQWGHITKGVTTHTIFQHDGTDKHPRLEADEAGAPD